MLNIVSFPRHHFLCYSRRDLASPPCIVLRISRDHTLFWDPNSLLLMLGRPKIDMYRVIVKWLRVN